MSDKYSQTSDPGENHSNNSQNGGDADFSGQPGYDTESDGFSAKVPIKQSDTSNPLNGSGGSRKVIAPGKVKGINP